MKNKLLLAALFVVTVLLVAGCGAATTITGETIPPNGVPPAPNKYLVTLSAQDFNQQPNISKSVMVNAGDTFTIALDSNATTGFQWNEQANIKNAIIISQISHNYVAPNTNSSDKLVVGMGGIEEWVFQAGQKGSTLVNFSYGRPWAGGEKDVRTFDLTVEVK